MISSEKGPKLKHKWAIAAVGGVAAVALGMLVLGSDDNNDKAKQPEAASSDNAGPQVDANQRFFVARVPSNFYRRANTEDGSLVGTFAVGSCVVLVGENGQFTRAHIRSNTSGPASGYTNSANFENTTIRNEVDCVATVLGENTGGFLPSERYYTIGNNVPVPLYRDPSGEGEVIAYIQPNSCVMRKGSGPIRAIIAQNAQDVRHEGYVRFAESPYGTFQSPSVPLETLTDATCLASFDPASPIAPAPEAVRPPSPESP